MNRNDDPSMEEYDDTICANCGKDLPEDDSEHNFNGFCSPECRQELSKLNRPCDCRDCRVYGTFLESEFIRG